MSKSKVATEESGGCEEAEDEEDGEDMARTRYREG